MSRLVLAIALAVLAATAALAAPAGAATRAPAGFFGVMVNGVLDAPQLDLGQESARMRADGVESERFEIAWDLVEPQRGSYDFASTDRKVAAAAGAGIDVLALVVRTPAWAARTPGNPFSPPRHNADYAAFLRTLIARYGPNGSFWAQNPSVPAHPVRNWEIWNEPNLPDYFAQQPFAKPYARLLAAAYTAVKGSDAGARVVMAGMANYSWRDLRTLYGAGIPLRFDVAAVHPFSGRPSNSVKITRLNRQVLDAHGDRSKPIWLTELTWSSAKGKKQPLTQDWETTEAGQAARLQAAYHDYMAARKSLRLDRIFWYTWATIDRDSPNSFDYSGLRTRRADGTLADKPALIAFRAAARRYGAR